MGADERQDARLTTHRVGTIFSTLIITNDLRGARSVLDGAVLRWSCRWPGAAEIFPMIPVATAPKAMPRLRTAWPRG